MLDKQLWHYNNINILATRNSVGRNLFCNILKPFHLAFLPKFLENDLFVG